MIRSENGVFPEQDPSVRTTAFPNRRDFLCRAGLSTAVVLGLGSASSATVANTATAGSAAKSRLNTIDGENDYDQQIQKGLLWLSNHQSRLGGWPDATYEVAITALSGLALICSGSTTVQGPYAAQIRLTVDFLINRARNNGLIGNPARDSRYTYGHGFSMLFLSQVLGEEEDADRRKNLRRILQHAVEFSVSAQTRSGGWGYVSAKDGNDFDEGSTTITQVQGLRGCRNAGIAVSGEAIERAKKYIYDCSSK